MYYCCISQHSGVCMLCLASAGERRKLADGSCGCNTTASFAVLLPCYAERALALPEVPELNTPVNSFGRVITMCVQLWRYGQRQHNSTDGLECYVERALNTTTAAREREFDIRSSYNQNGPVVVPKALLV